MSIAKKNISIENQDIINKIMKSKSVNKEAYRGQVSKRTYYICEFTVKELLEIQNILYPDDNPKTYKEYVESEFYQKYILGKGLYDKSDIIKETKT